MCIRDRMRTTLGVNLSNLGITSTATELNILDGVTATAAEINTLDGITSTTAELNILDGVTATAAEINSIEGITSSTAVVVKAVKSVIFLFATSFPLGSSLG